MRKIKFVFQIVIAFVIALFAYNSMYAPQAESVRSAVQSKLPAAWQQEGAASGSEVPAGKLRISVLDVGQADAILLQDAKQTVMIDVGNSRVMSAKNTSKPIKDRGGKEALVKELDKAGVKRINTVIVTHHHADHMGNIMYVRGKYGVKNIYDSGFVNQSNPTSVQLHKDLQAGQYNNRVLRAGDTIKLDKGYYLEVLAPGDFIDSKLYKNLNNTSVVLKLHYGQFTMLLTGDAEVGVEDALQKKYGAALKADVLKVGHHGSKTSSYWQFINKVQPKYALISCGPYEIYHHPNADTVGRLQHAGAKVLTTFDHGTLTVTTDGKTFDVKTQM